MTENLALRKNVLKIPYNRTRRKYLVKKEHTGNPHTIKNDEKSLVKNEHTEIPL